MFSRIRTFFSRIYMGFLYIAAFIFIIFIAVNYIDGIINYKEANARITEISSSCIMEKRGLTGKYYSKEIPCEIAEYAVKSHPDWLNYDVKYNYTFQVSYFTSNDKKLRSQTLKTSLEPTQINKYKINDTIKILVNKNDPDKIRESAW